MALKVGASHEKFQLSFSLALAEIQYEVKAGAFTCAESLRSAMRSLGLNMPSRLVFRFAGKVELGGEQRTVRRLHADVEMSRPSGIDSRHDGI